MSGLFCSAVCLIVIPFEFICVVHLTIVFGSKSSCSFSYSIIGIGALCIVNEHPEIQTAVHLGQLGFRRIGAKGVERIHHHHIYSVDHCQI